MAPKLEERLLGKVINGKYRVVSLLGEGGMGAVFEGVSLDTGQPCALKFTLPDFAAASSGAHDRFLREARVIASLRHPHIVSVVGELERFEEMVFIPMELLKGEPLDERLLSRGPLSWKDAFGLALQAAEALGFAHAQHIVHRDLKPGNLFVTDKGVLKVMDFGIAKVLDATRMTRPGSLLGSCPYMSREQAMGAENLDQRSDIYSLGAVVYELISGQRPYGTGDVMLILSRIAQFDATDIATYVPALPQQVRSVVMRALNQDRDARYQTMEEFAAAMRSCLVPTKAAHETPTHQLDAHAVSTQPLPTTAEGIPHAIAPESSSRRVVTSGQGARHRGVRLAIALGVALIVGGTAALSMKILSKAPAEQQDLGEQVAVARDLSRAADLAQVVGPPIKPPGVPSPNPPGVESDESGRLFVRSFPPAVVSIDGRRIGATPVLGHALRPGKYLVELKTNTGRVERRNVSIHAGRSETIKVLFQ